MRELARLIKDEDGQGMVEYALILGGIALVAIVAINFLNVTIADIFNDMISRLSG